MVPTQECGERLARQKQGVGRSRLLAPRKVLGALRKVLQAWSKALSREEGLGIDLMCRPGRSFNTCNCVWGRTQGSTE